MLDDVPVRLGPAARVIRLCRDVDLPVTGEPSGDRPPRMGLYATSYARPPNQRQAGGPRIPCLSGIACHVPAAAGGVGNSMFSGHLRLHRIEHCSLWRMGELEVREHRVARQWRQMVL